MPVSGLEDIWWGRARPSWPAAAALSAAEGLFRAGAALRGALYDAGLVSAERAGAPVLSIGNLVVGGSGKTPATLALAERLLRRGRRVAVLSRGYAARSRGARVVSDGERVLLGADEAGDEPLLLARRLSGVAVLCGPRRAELARRAVEELQADALVLDDGFQHRSLRRDLDVVVVDAAAPEGNGRLLPRGPNREPWSALGRAHLAWISRSDQVSTATLAALRARLASATGRPPVLARYAVREVLDGLLARSFGPGALGGRRVVLLCALARPEGFRRTLADLGAEVVLERVFRDHHRFTEGELEETLRAAEAAGCDAVATTEKDAVRLPTSVAAHSLWRVVRIEAEIVEGGEVLDDLIARAIGATPLPSPPPASGGREQNPSTPTSTPTPTPTSTSTDERARASTSPSPPPGERAGERGPHGG